MRPEALRVAPAADPLGSLALMRPRLSSEVIFHQQRSRGERWYLLEHPLLQTRFRCSPATVDLLRLLDGRCTLAEAWTELHGGALESAPDREALVALLVQLHEADLLRDGFPDGEEAVVSRRRRHRRLQRSRRWWSPLAVRFALLDPNAGLARCIGLGRWLFSWPTLALWCGLLILAAVTVLANVDGLTAHWQTRFFDPQNLLWLWLLYPLAKALHELAHGLACKVCGGEVHEMGIMLLVFMPIPYVDASSSARFASKYRRMLVAAAGIMMELLLASVAILIWLMSEPGLARDLAFNLLLICGLSSLLFNGNPLLRFDGYYVLSDWLEIPNLGTRSNRYLGYLVQRYLFGLQGTESPVAAPGEARWFLCYGIAAGLYRLLITLSIALFVAGHYLLPGILLALWALTGQILIPAYRALMRVWPKLRAQRQVLRGLSVFFLPLFALTILLFVLPWSQSTYAEGVIRLPEHAALRADSEGVVSQVLAANGQLVKRGDPLLQLEDPELAAKIQLLQGKLRENQLRQDQQRLRDPVRLSVLEEEQRGLDAQLRDLERQRDGLLLRSPANGTLTLLRDRDLPGRFVEKGAVLGMVHHPSGAEAMVAVPQADARRARENTRFVELKLLSDPQRTLTGDRLREVPSGTERLPSRFLGSQSGGVISVDARDREGVRALEPVFLFSITLPGNVPAVWVGQRVAVRFIHHREPPGWRWAHTLMRYIQHRLSQP